MPRRGSGTGSEPDRGEGREVIVPEVLPAHGRLDAAGAESVSIRLVQQAAEGLRAMKTQGVIATALAIGEYLLQTFYAGDLRVLAMVGRGHASVQELASGGHLGVSGSSVWEYLAFVPYVRALPAASLHAKPYAFHREVLVLEDVNQQVSLVIEAIDSGWDRATLRSAVGGLLPPRQGPRGRRRSHPIDLAARAMSRKTRDLIVLASGESGDEAWLRVDGAVAAGLETFVHEVDDKKATSVLKRIRREAQRLRRVAEALERSMEAEAAGDVEP